MAWKRKTSSSRSRRTTFTRSSSSRSKRTTPTKSSSTKSSSSRRYTPTDRFSGVSASKAAAARAAIDKARARLRTKSKSSSKTSTSRATIDRARATIDRSRAVRARAAKEAETKRKYEAAIKKFGSGKNIINAAVKKYGVNSSETKKIRAYVQKSERFANKKTATTPKIRTNVVKKVNTKVDYKKGFTQGQYNELIKKYGTVEKIKAASVNRYGANSSKTKKIGELLDRYNSVSKPKVKKIRENNTTITDSNKRNFANDFGGTDNNPKINEKVIFAKKWNSPERMGAAKKYGIDNYIGTAAQNTLLRKKIREDNKKVVPTKKVENNDSSNQTEDNTLGGSARTVESATVQEKNKKNVETLKKWRLSGITDSDILTKAEEKYGKDSKKYEKIKKLLNENPEKDGTEKVDSTILEKKREDLYETQIDALEGERDNNISITAENYLKGKEVIAGNNETLQEFYKTMANDLREFIKTSTETKNAALERTKTSELNKVTGRIRALLARRGIDISNIPPEQLIAMSGEVGGQALDAINEAISKTEDEILKLTERKTAEINKYLEQGLIKQAEADTSIEQLRQLKEKMIADIKSNYITNAFNIARANLQDKDNNKAEVINTVSKFVTQLGISGTAQSIMEKYIDNLDSVEAMKEMVSDLNNKNSELYKAVADIEKAALLQKQLEDKVRILRATPRTTTSSVIGSGTKKLGEATIRALVLGEVPNATSIRTYGDLEAAINRGGEIAKKIKEVLAKADIGIKYVGGQ